jgi:hypothetical protein
MLELPLNQSNKSRENLKTMEEDLNFSWNNNRYLESIQSLFLDLLDVYQDLKKCSFESQQDEIWIELCQEEI